LGVGGRKARSTAAAGLMRGGKGPWFKTDQTTGEGPGRLGKPKHSERVQKPPPQEWRFPRETEGRKPVIDSTGLYDKDRGAGRIFSGTLPMPSWPLQQGAPGRGRPGLCGHRRYGVERWLNELGSLRSGEDLPDRSRSGPRVLPKANGATSRPAGHLDRAGFGSGMPGQAMLVL